MMTTKNETTTCPHQKALPQEAMHLSGNNIGCLMFYDGRCRRQSTVEGSRDVQVYYRNIATIDPAAFIKFRFLIALDLSNNNITSLPEDVFQGNAQLLTLNLSKNRISYLPPRVFQSLKALQSLSLYDNCLEELDEDLLADNKALRHIYFGENQLVDIHPDTFRNLPDLEELSLANNSLTTFDFSTLIKSQGIRRLDLSGNEWTHVKDYGYFRTYCPYVEIIGLIESTSKETSIARNKVQIQSLRVRQ